MRKEKLKMVLKELGFFAMQFFFSRIFLFDRISPVGLAFAFSRVFFGGNILAITSGYFISKLYMCFSFSEMIIVCYEIVFLTLYFFVREFLKSKQQLICLYVFLILSNALRIYFDITSLDKIIYFCVHL